jgi:hypothetical protein
MLPQDNSPSTGLGNAVDDYLTAHGYTADARRAIVCASSHSCTTATVYILPYSTLID